MWTFKFEVMLYLVYIKNVVRINVYACRYV